MQDINADSLPDCLPGPFGIQAVPIPRGPEPGPEDAAAAAAAAAAPLVVPAAGRCTEQARRMLLQLAREYNLSCKVAPGFVHYTGFEGACEQGLAFVELSPHIDSHVDRRGGARAFAMQCANVANRLLTTSIKKATMRTRPFRHRPEPYPRPICNPKPEHDSDANSEQTLI